jgi:hypothetical protein
VIIKLSPCSPRAQFGSFAPGRNAMLARESGALIFQR